MYVFSMIYKNVRRVKAWRCFMNEKYYSQNSYQNGVNSDEENRKFEINLK